MEHAKHRFTVNLIFVKATYTRGKNIKDLEPGTEEKRQRGSGPTSISPMCVGPTTAFRW